MTGQAEASDRRTGPGAATALSDPRSWVDLHGDILFRFALARLRDRHAAEEAVQEALLAALGARATFAGHCAERTWLIGILKHKVVDHLRRRIRDRGQGDEPDNDTTEKSAFTWESAWRQPPRRWSSAAQEDPASDLERQEFAAALRECLAGVPERAAQAFVLKIVDETDSDEICKVLSITPTNLWVLLHRARLRLRACLEQRWFLARDQTSAAKDAKPPAQPKGKPGKGRP
ncbi:MAG: sigma-70 family RNA polymerase sigma factor [Planctomycetota bacterium]|nr:sigma-70 family RNA polymerase sigma factor [Planctomycetota bacterium]